MKTEFHMKWPLKIIPGHLFCSRQRIAYRHNNAGINFKVSEEVAMHIAGNCCL